jgi:surface antigen
MPVRGADALHHPLMSSSEGSTMSPLKAVIPVVAGLMIAASAQAQLLPTWETNIVLSQQDLDLIHGAVTNQIHGKPVGTTTLWSNPASGNSGVIKLGKKLTRKNQQCEEIEYTVRSGGTPVYTEHYHFTSCLQPDGLWKIA